MTITQTHLRIVSNLPEDLLFVSDSQDVAEIQKFTGETEYDSYFVGQSDGEYTEIWGMSGIVPRLSKLCARVFPKDPTVTLD